MTKLMQWLMAAALFISVWLGLLTKQISLPLPISECHVYMLPIYAIALFGLASVSIILYRVLTFNNCDEAARQLKSQIKEAEEFYKKHGLNINE